MRSLLTPCLLAAVLAAGGAGAQPPAANLVTVSLSEATDVAETTAAPDALITVHVVLVRPRNPHLTGGEGAPVDNVGCYAFTLDLSPNLVPADDGAAGPPAKQPDCSGVCYPLRTCYGSLLPVGPDDRITLRSFVLRYLGPGPGEIRLRPPALEILSGAMDYWYRDAALTGWVLPMYPAHGDHAQPLFVVRPDRVPVAAAAWGAVKVRYR
jgi:hypothetical protein